MDLLARIDAWGKSAPDKVAHHSDGVTLTWGDLVRRSDALAGAIASLRLTVASPLVLRGHKEPEMLVGFLGCVKAGHPYVPVDVSVPQTRVDRIVSASGAELVLTPERIRELESRDDPPPPSCGDATTPLYVMFTSGSTGEPKGVVITRGCIDAFLGWMLAEQQFARGAEVFLNQAIFSFDLSVMDTWCCLATGGTLVSLTAADLTDYRRLFTVLEQSCITSWVSTPAFAQLCLAERRFTAALLPGLRRFLFCGDVLTPEVAGKLLERFPDAEVWNTYGPTEATVATTSVRIDRDIIQRYPQLPVGMSMPGTSIVLDDEHGQPVPPGVKGEIVIIGPNVSTGYLGRPDLTARVFSVRHGMRAYRTGDWGVFEGDLLFFHGRMDNQVKIGGHRIELGDIETHLASLPSVRGAVVIASLKNGRPDSLHAFIVFSDRPEGSELDVAALLRRQLSALVPAYMLPRKFHILDGFPLTANGKTDRRVLEASIGG